jgi:hypothetical protein
MESTLVFVKGAPYFCPISTKFRLFRNIFTQNCNKNYIEIPPVKTALIHADRQTDKYETNWGNV